MTCALRVLSARSASTRPAQPAVLVAAPRVVRARQGRCRRATVVVEANWNVLGGLEGLIKDVAQLVDSPIKGNGKGSPTSASSSSSSADSSSNGSDTASSSAATATAAAAAPESDEEKSDDYTAEMQAKMGTTLTYRHEDGINWTDILPDLIIGSCLQTPADADRLAAAGVTTVFNLQEDCDMEYFSIDIAAIRARCAEVGIKHVRFPVRDFDPFDLRLKLPKAVSKLAQSHDPKEGKVYIHCTAGLGRAPSTALAYMFWLRGWDLEEGREAITGKRACTPRVESIRAATADLLSGTGPIPVTVGLRRWGTAQKVQVAGLDVGWHTRLDMAFNPDTSRMEVTRQLLPGNYPFKFVLDDVWSASFDYPTMQDGANTNNVLEVLPREGDEAALRERILSSAGKLTSGERGELASMLCPWDSHDTASLSASPCGSSKAQMAAAAAAAGPAAEAAAAAVGTAGALSVNAGLEAAAAEAAQAAAGDKEKQEEDDAQVAANSSY